MELPGAKVPPALMVVVLTMPLLPESVPPEFTITSDDEAMEPSMANAGVDRRLPV